MLQHRIEQLPRLFRVAVGQQLHGAFEVGKQHRDLLTLAFKGAARGENLLREIGRGVRQWRPSRRLSPRRGGWGRGMGGVRPHNALLVLADRISVGIAQLSEEIAQGFGIQLELALQGAIGHAAPLVQQGKHLIHERDKVHPVSSLLFAGPVYACATLS